MKPKKTLLPLLLLPIVISMILQVLPGQSQGCTLWGAAGDDVGGGTITSKNRDWKPDHVQVLKVHRDGRYAYLGLYAEGNDKPGLKQGVNEKGLGVISATAGSIPMAKREAGKGKPRLMSTLLAGYASCDQVLADKDKLFSNRKPAFFLISDAQKIVTVELGLQGHFAVTVATTGTVTHTNHYLSASLVGCNDKIGESSAIRVKRISQLLQTAPRPLNMAAFASMSRDQHDGANNSLWRTGTGSHTLSSWILQCPGKGAPTLRLLIADPGKPERLESLFLDKKFWKQPPALVQVAEPGSSHDDSDDESPQKTTTGSRGSREKARQSSPGHEASVHPR